MEAAKGFVPYLNVTTRSDKHPDQGMLQKKGGAGFPHVVLMNEEGLVMHQFRPMSQGMLDEALQEAQKKAKEFADLRAEAEKNPADVDMQASFLAKRLGMENDPLVLEKLKALVAGGKLKPGTQKNANREIALQDFRAVFNELNETMAKHQDEDEEAQKKIAAPIFEKLTAMVKAGQKLDLEHPEQEYAYFWMFAGFGAISSKNAEVLAEAKKALTTLKEKNPRAGGLLSALEEEEKKASGG